MRPHIVAAAIVILMVISIGILYKVSESAAMKKVEFCRGKVVTEIGGCGHGYCTVRLSSDEIYEMYKPLLGMECK